MPDFHRVDILGTLEALLEYRLRPRSIASDGITEEAGQRLRQIRERLSLTIRDVEEASRLIAERHQNDEFVVGLSRLSEIENRGSVPTIYRVYSLCVIYRLEPAEVLEWYGVDMASVAADAAMVDVSRSHLVRFRPDGRGYVQLPLSLDPGIDFRKTTHLSRMIKRWGKLPLVLLNGLDLRNHRYGFIGSDDWTMYPILQPGSFVMIDESRRKIAASGWTNEFERPIYFLEHRSGWACGWCFTNEKHLVLQPHPASDCAPQMFKPNEVDVVGQVTGVAMRLDLQKRRRGRSASS